MAAWPIGLQTAAACSFALSSTNIDDSLLATSHSWRTEGDHLKTGQNGEERGEKIRRSRHELGGHGVFGAV